MGQVADKAAADELLPDGFSGEGQLNADHEAEAAHFLDRSGVAFADAADGLHELAPKLGRALVEMVTLHDLHDFGGHGGRQGAAAERGGMAAGDEALGDFIGGHHRAHRQAVGKGLGAGDGVGFEIEMLERPRLAGAEQAALHLVHEEEDALFAAERLNALGVFGVHGADAALALYDFNEHGGGFGRNRGLKRVQVAPRHGLEAVRDGREPVLKAFLPRGGHRRIRTPVECLFQRNDFVGVDVLHPLHVAAGQLDLRFVGLRAGVAEERLSKVAQGQQFLSQFKLFFLIKKVAHMDELAGLLLDDLGDFLVAVAEAGYRDPGQQVDVFLAVEVGDSGAFAAGDADRVTTVRPAEKGFFAGLDRIERGSGHDGISCPAAAGMLI